MKMDFTQQEAYDLVYAAREAQIRYRRARTEKRKGNPAYQLWDDDTLDEYIAHYKEMEQMLQDKYQQTFGEPW